MTGTLRDRIESVLWANFDEAAPSLSMRDMADAVIAEIGTDCIYRYVCAHCGEFWFDQSERMQRFALLHNKGHLTDET